MLTSIVGNCRLFIYTGVITIVQYINDVCLSCSTTPIRQKTTFLSIRISVANGAVSHGVLVNLTVVSGVTMYRDATTML